MTGMIDSLQNRVNRCGSQSGAALVITLILITLMLFLLMAFFSQSALERGSANASASLAAENGQMH